MPQIKRSADRDGVAAKFQAADQVARLAAEVAKLRVEVAELKRQVRSALGAADPLGNLPPPPPGRHEDSIPF